MLAPFTEAFVSLLSVCVLWGPAEILLLRFIVCTLTLPLIPLLLFLPHLDILAKFIKRKCLIGSGFDIKVDQVIMQDVELPLV